MSSLKEICNGIPDPLPQRRQRDETVPHAPVRTPELLPAEQRVCHTVNLVEENQSGKQ
jgi:urocanate hydratase